MPLCCKADRMASESDAAAMALVLAALWGNFSQATVLDIKSWLRRKAANMGAREFTGSAPDEPSHLSKSRNVEFKCFIFSYY